MLNIKSEMTKYTPTELNELGAGKMALVRQNYAFREKEWDMLVKAATIAAYQMYPLTDTQDGTGVIELTPEQAYFRARFVEWMVKGK